MASPRVHTLVVMELALLPCLVLVFLLLTTGRRQFRMRDLSGLERMYGFPNLRAG